ncbi:MAG: capsular polysaccharide biosynthesis protein [Firmicutes bacterium]|nr:capsular polysaccharide biosynthesis protein [Bacillota bacterium]
MFKISEKEYPPQGVYQSTREWINTLCLEKSDAGELYTEYHPGDIFHSPEPKSLEKVMHWKFRRDNHHESPAAFVAIVPGGRVWGDNGVVITPDNKLLADISNEYNKTTKEHPIFREENLPPVDYSLETVAVLASIWSFNYYHWMFDILPRIALLRSSNIAVDKFIINLSGALFQQDTLSVLGIPEAKIIKSYNQFHLEAAQLVVPSLPGDLGYMPRWACEFIRKEFLIDRNIEMVEGYERIYISRVNATSRQVINEPQVRNVLAKYGFKSVMLDSMSLADQAMLFSSARIIVSPHGAGFANLVFCSPGTKVIEFFSPNYVNVLYWHLSNKMNLDYYYFIGEGNRSPEYVDPHYIWENISVNIKTLIKTMELAGIQ